MKASGASDKDITNELLKAASDPIGYKYEFDGVQRVIQTKPVYEREAYRVKAAKMLESGLSDQEIIKGMNKPSLYDAVRSTIGDASATDDEVEMALNDFAKSKGISLGDVYSMYVNGTLNLK
jgi:hypothetical protein